VNSLVEVLVILEGDRQAIDQDGVDIAMTANPECHFISDILRHIMHQWQLWQQALCTADIGTWPGDRYLPALYKVSVAAATSTAMADHDR